MGKKKFNRLEDGEALYSIEDVMNKLTLLVGLIIAIFMLFVLTGLLLMCFFSVVVLLHLPVWIALMISSLGISLFWIHLLASETFKKWSQEKSELREEFVSEVSKLLPLSLIALYIAYAFMVHTQHLDVLYWTDVATSVVANILWSMLIFAGSRDTVFLTLWPLDLIAWVTEPFRIRLQEEIDRKAREGATIIDPTQTQTGVDLTDAVGPRISRDGEIIPEGEEEDLQDPPLKSGSSQ